jgi:hypothetical protein
MRQNYAWQPQPTRQQMEDRAVQVLQRPTTFVSC